MNSTSAPQIDPKRWKTSIARILFMGAGVYALTCAAAILIMERLGWSQSFFHVTQIVATILCGLAAALFLWLTRGARFDWARRVAITACVLSGLWMALVLYIFITLDFSAIDLRKNQVRVPSWLRTGWWSDAHMRPTHWGQSIISACS